jgi:hypothetical protein
MKYILIFLFFLAILFEATFVQFPLTIILLLLLFVFKKTSDIFAYAFLTGLILDILQVRDVGIMSLFLITFLFLVSFYDKKYEIKTAPFVIIAGLTGSLLHNLLFRQQFHIFSSVLMTVVAGIGFILVNQMQLLSKKKHTF